MSKHKQKGVFTMKNIRTDLAVEAHELSRINAQKAGDISGVVSDVRTENDITVTDIKITNHNGEKALGKSIGNYCTIEAPNLKYSIEDYEYVCKMISAEIQKMHAIHSDFTTLVVGLGNRAITPDALGTEVVKKLMITRHIKQYRNDLLSEGISGVCAITPGVLGTTGVETVEIVKSVTDKIKPDLVIAVDSMAAADIKRVSTTIQISDTGIQPGAGVGNNREALNKETLGVEVIAIGVPTVIDASTISDIEIPDELKPLMVTTKDIDLVIERASKAVANGINLALHKNLTLRDIESYV